MTTKRKTLGRGLDALLSTPNLGTEPAATRPAGESLRYLPVDGLERGRYQPRLDMRPETLEELADSIRAQGVVQPIVVRPFSTAGKSIISRLWRCPRFSCSTSTRECLMRIW